MWVFFVFLGGVIFFGVLWVRLSGCFLEDGLGEVVVFECVGDGDCDFVVLERLNGIFWFFFFFCDLVKVGFWVLVRFVWFLWID